MPSIVFLTGPTASGKTAVAIEASLRLNAEIVNADAYQVYEGMSLLTAAPGNDEKQKVPHHLLEFLNVSEGWNATDHYYKAMEAVADINRRGKTALVVGGSGLYLKFLSHGISDAPPASDELRKEWKEVPLKELVARFRELDPEGAALTNLENRRYVIRNLEIVVLGGKPLSYWRGNWDRPSAGPGFYLDWNVGELDARIRTRTKDLLDNGAIEEVMALPARSSFSSTALKTLGLSQIDALLRGEISREECESLIIMRTRQYAKRQRTWFRREGWLVPLACSGCENPVSVADKLLSHLELRSD